jgi:hypothetical protein
MSKSKNYTVNIKVATQTNPLQSAIKDFHGFMSVLLLINAPFRVYHMLMRDVHGVQQLAAASAGGASAAISTEAGSADVAAGSLSLMNQQLATAVLLMGALSEGAAIPGMIAGETAAATLVAAAVAGGAAVPVLQRGGMVTQTGAAVVERGEQVIPAGGAGGMGDVNVNIANVNLDPAGMSLSDFTNQLGENIATSIRALTRNLPV